MNKYMTFAKDRERGVEGTIHWKIRWPEPLFILLRRRRAEWKDQNLESKGTVESLICHLGLRESHVI